MTYTYRCNACQHEWEVRLAYEQRETPCEESCPQCELLGGVVRTYTAAPRISYQGAYTTLQRAGSGWNDVLNKIKKASGRNAKIETR
jgi:predicted nucleic acid-binding Zn ribbon protein